MMNEEMCGWADNSEQQFLGTTAISGWLLEKRGDQ